MNNKTIMEFGVCIIHMKNQIALTLSCYQREKIVYEKYIKSN